MPNFIVLGIYFIFGTKFFWNEGIYTCFNVEFVLLGRNIDFLGGYWWLLLVTVGYCPTARSCSFPLLVLTHKGIYENEIVDSLAKIAAKKATHLPPKIDLTMSDLKNANTQMTIDKSDRG